ncbi:phosphate transport system regulatory protein PhoU [Pilimelia anulata]|uniref:Phosphate-specific transport system accessory protein PhoU n=1 Tax=Pilimelia anulata TaxID=53371 RepID=A0A8J3B6D8_9ACTN|nr:phosphate signaling complex protein PhoU [Pilimelia anulata]GGJ91447.1 phosphate transport system regulatory protein PhoU [Pilimelia anulata]
MREEFDAALLEIGRLLVSMGEAVRTAMSQATDALIAADLELAEAVVARDAAIDAMYHDVEQGVHRVLALRAPVASDLRAVVSALHIAGDVERMGDLATHVARTARRRHPAPALPQELVGVFRQMGNVADRLVAEMTSVLSAPNAARAARLNEADDAMDSLHRQLLQVVLGPGWPHGIEPAVDAALLGRFYERYADHAVNVGEHVVYLVTGAPAGPGADQRP